MFANLTLKNTVLVASLIYWSSLSASAQITTDGTTSTTVTPNGNNFTIEQGDREGGNLFHSFQEFSVPNGGEAFFNNAVEVNSIFSRVTGGNLSNIDGLIRANGSANLFLINPAGILFGEGARLNIGGSFYGSTADSILFPNEGEFSAINPDNSPLLTINAPIGLNFRDNPAEILVRGADLRVNPGQTLALLGGNISFDNTQTFPIGVNIELGGLSSSGTIALDDNLSLSFPENVNRADVSLAGGSIIFVNNDGEGSIRINAANVTLTEGSQLLAGINNSTNPNAQAGDIIIDATETISLTGNSGIDNNVQPNELGSAGNIELTASNIELSENSRLNSLIFSGAEANTGNLILDATENIVLENSILATQIQEGGIGNAGNIELSATNISLNDNSQLNSVIVSGGTGNTGNLLLNATDSIRIEDSIVLNQIQQNATSGFGNGNIEINANSLSIVSLPNPENAIASRILNNTLGNGNAGNITINTTDSILLDKGGIASQVTSVPDNAIAQGNAGTIELNTGSATLQNRSELLSDTNGRGDAGNIIINARENILLDGNSLILSQIRPGSEGNAGNINLSAEGTLTSRNFSFISTNVQSGGSGQGGNLTITAPEVILTEGAIFDALTENNVTARNNDGGSINVEAQTLQLTAGGKIITGTDGNGNAGNIELQISGSLEIDGANAPERPAEFPAFEEQLLNDLETETGLFANTTENSSGNGGSINIANPTSFTIVNGGQVTVDSQGTGNGGSLVIQTNSLTLDNQAQLLAATQFSQEGSNLSNITLQIADTLSLKGDSQISARAFNEANGGNINIDAKFVIAFSPQIEGNDIIANAELGNGGNIRIKAEEILGLQEREATPGNGTNDIDASSEFGFDGTVSLETPDVGAMQGIVELSPNIVEVSERFTSACATERVADGSNFIIKGRGGIPHQPIEVLTADNILMGEELSWAKLSQETNSDKSLEQQYPPIMTNQGKIYPARGLVIQEDGSVILTRYPSDIVSQRSLELPENCTPSAAVQK